MGNHRTKQVATQYKKQALTSILDDLWSFAVKVPTDSLACFMNEDWIENNESSDVNTAKSHKISLIAVNRDIKLIKTNKIFENVEAMSFDAAIVMKCIPNLFFLCVLSFVSSKLFCIINQLYKQ